MTFEICVKGKTWIPLPKPMDEIVKKSELKIHVIARTLCSKTLQIVHP